MTHGPDDRYTHGHHRSVLRSHGRRTVEDSATYLLPHLRPGQRLLDVGCGPATITAGLAARVAPGRVTAVEATPTALAAARDGLATLGVEGVELVLGDVHRLDLPDDSFDVVHAHQVLQHVADPVLALREMRRVCRPGGLVAVRDADYAAFAWWPALPGLDRWMRLYQAAARANGGEPDAGRRLVHWARAAGFTDVTPSASTWCFATPEDRAWWGGTWEERITASALADQLRRDGLADVADLARIAAAWRDWAAAEDGWIALAARRGAGARLTTSPSTSATCRRGTRPWVSPRRGGAARRC